jgi:hypothetical protein
MGTLHDPLTGQHLQFRKTGKQTGGQLLEAEVLLDPGGHVPPPSAPAPRRAGGGSGGIAQHPAWRRAPRLTKGESVEVPRRRILHRVPNTHQGHTRFLLQVRPARRMGRHAGRLRGRWSARASPPPTRSLSSTFGTTPAPSRTFLASG